MAMEFKFDMHVLVLLLTDKVTSLTCLIRPSSPRGAKPVHHAPSASEVTTMWRFIN